MNMRRLFSNLAMLLAVAFAPLLRADGETNPPMAKPAAAETAKAAEDAGFKSEDPKYAEADTVLNEARANLGDAASARQRIIRLEAVQDYFQDYKYRADAFYFIGLNEQLLGENDRAIAAFEAALQTEPDIARETPIVSYLRAAKGRAFIRTANVALLALLVAALLPALWRLTRADAGALPWARLALVYTGATVVWVALVFLVPGLMGALHKGLDAFPKPMLSNFRLGQLGDDPLRALLAYGLGAIWATLPVVAATACVRRPAARRALTLLGVTAVIGAIMGLYAIRHLYVDARYHGDSQRLVFMVRSVDSFKDVPDEMLPLYDGKFRKRILDSRKQAAK